MVKPYIKPLLLMSVLVFTFLFSLNLINANTYISDIYFIVPDTVFVTNERVELKGWIYLTNYSANGTLITNSSLYASANINLTILNSTRGVLSNYTLTTNANGTFYTKSNFYSTGIEVNASATAGYYSIRAEYKDPNNSTWFSEVGIIVVNQSVEILKISSEKARYYSSEIVNIDIEALRQIGDSLFFVNNVSINGSLRNSTKSIINSFNCTTGTNGKCSVNLTAPSTYGNYFLELDDFKAYSSFSVIPFSHSVYMRDELGKSLKNIFSTSEQARIEVSIANASDSDTYTFSGYIADSSGNNIKNIASTTLTSNNSFKNSFLFTVDSVTFSYGVYTAFLTISKTGDGSATATTSFRVEDWALSVEKKASNSGFEYGYSAFPSKEMKFEIYPTYRGNGSLIANLSSSSFTINIKDNLNNILNITNVTWNSTCATSGCYEFSITSPTNTGKYYLDISLSYSGSLQTETKIINVINGIISAQSTNREGDLKELFGTNEYIYISFTSYNSTSAGFNLSDAEVFIVQYMNGSEFSYTNVTYDAVNSSNSAYEWGWNSTNQRIRLDVPKIGGIYNLYLFGNNRTLGTTAKIIVNPYSVCGVAKNTAGSVDNSNYFYVWQFKTTDTIYFELKIIQATNPLGRATADNASTGNGTATGSQCTVDTSTQQVISNATLSVIEVRNAESGQLQSLNTSSSTCQASDNSGGYTCTIKPLNKWDGGQNVVKLKVQGQDGTIATAYSRFEARAFYLYGWSQTWQNNPSDNITMTVQLYEAGKSWWSSWGSSGGLSGTVTVKKIEYMGRDGEWIWPPVDSGYNVSALNSTSITSGQGTISIPASNAKNGQWKTGNYRAVLKGTTSAGDSDYGYAWFGVKLWDVYGSPVECSVNASTCWYKDYFNSKENVTIYIKISKAGNYNYGYSGGENIYGNVTISVKKIDDCRKWPCKELNSSLYQAGKIIVNSSSPWYWNANPAQQRNYTIQINTTNVSTGSWGTGYYNVVLDVNGTDTGYAWFNTIAFYVRVKPTDVNGSDYKYNIKPDDRMYFNISAIKGYKGWYANYNDSDFVNVTVDSLVLRRWDEGNFKQVEYNYPKDLNISSISINGTAVLNITMNASAWGNGYYWGELTLKNSDDETSSGWLNFGVKPFRVSISVDSGFNEVDTDQCINVTLNIYEPDWSSNGYLHGNYSIDSVYEDVWSGMSRSKITYTNYTNSSFNATGVKLQFCPNNNNWGGGSWGGWHYLNIVVKNNSNNNTANGWLNFKSVPFSISWGSVEGGNAKLTTANANVVVNITKSLSGESTTGNLTSLYQWRYESYRSYKEEYNFSVGGCSSWVSGQCNLTGSQNVTIYAPGNGWKIGYNYLYSEWTPVNNANSKIEDWNGIYIDGRVPYNSYFDNRDLNNNWKYNFRNNENLTIKVNVRHLNYSDVSESLTVTSVSYAAPSNICYDEWCRTYTSASSWGLSTGGTTISNGSGIIQIAPSGSWALGNYYIKVGVSGSAGTSTLTGGMLNVKDFTYPNVTITSPLMNSTISGNNFSINWTTTETTNCNLFVVNYNNFNNWYCGGWNSTNSTNSSSEIISSAKVFIIANLV